MTKRLKGILFALLSVAILVVLDQLTKFLAVRYLSPEQGGSDVILWEGVFRLRYLENRGAAFGLLQGQKVLFVIMTVLVCIFLCWAYLRIPLEKHFLALRVVCVVVVSGALGNFIDRIRLDYVVDFFYFELIDFPIFNVADIYVTCSVIFFVLLFLFYYKEADLERIWPGRKGNRGEQS